MAQPSISTFFIARKRGIEDDAAVNKKSKVIRLERPRNSSDCNSDCDESAVRVIFANAPEDSAINEDATKAVEKQKIRQEIAPQRVTRKRKLHMQEVDGIETVKVVNFWKGGNLSPQKKSKASLTEQSECAANEVCSKVKDAAPCSGISVPIKQTAAGDSIEKTNLISNNGMNLDEIKKKLKGSARLAELKTSLNKMQCGFDKLDQLEKIRMSSILTKAKQEEAVGSPKTLKPFKTIELDILR